MAFFTCHIQLAVIRHSRLPLRMTAHYGKEIAQALPFFNRPGYPDFCQRVSDALAEGYQLYGNPVLVVVGGQPIVGQAVIWPNKDNLDG